MRRPPFAYDRELISAAAIARLEGGYSARGLASLAGYPSRRTLWRWGLEDPGFAARLAAAVACGRAVRRDAATAARAAGRGFCEDRAEALLVQVRLGVPVRALVRRPQGPSRDVLDDWKRLRPDFARALARAAREALGARFQAMRRGVARPYDEAVADAVMLRVMRGEPLRDVAKDPAMPGRATLTRWRRANPEFDAALRLAARPGSRARMTGRASRCTPALREAICAHLRRGGSLRSAAWAVAGAPHRVTLQVWMRADAGFARTVALARGARDEAMAQAALEIALAATPASLAADARAVGTLRKRWGQVGGGR